MIFQESLGKATKTVGDRMISAQAIILLNRVLNIFMPLSRMNGKGLTPKWRLGRALTRD